MRACEMGSVCWQKKLHDSFTAKIKIRIVHGDAAEPQWHIIDYSFFFFKKSSIQKKNDLGGQVVLFEIQRAIEENFGPWARAPRRQFLRDRSS